MFVIRTATLEDLPVLTDLVAESAWGLQQADYSPAQIAGALGTVYGVDETLVRDGTFFVIEQDGRPVACGGWSRRRTAFGSSRSPVKDDSLLDPEREAARIRGFFVHPSVARRGLATWILRECEAAALAAGFRDLELTATLTGVALYARNGYLEAKRFPLDLPNGERLPVVRMFRRL